MNIICAGFGGQGILTAGLIIGKTGVENGKNVTWLPSYGSEMRGGTANCSIKISDDKISSPFVKDIDILIVMNVPSAVKFGNSVKAGGLIVSNKTIVGDYKFKDDVKVVEVDATEIADKLENPKGGNIVMLGALAKAGDLFDEKTMIDGINAFFELKGKNNPKNLPCFTEGFNSAKIKDMTTV